MSSRNSPLVPLDTHPDQIVRKTERLRAALYGAKVDMRPRDPVDRELKLMELREPEANKHVEFPEMPKFLAPTKEED